MEHIVRCSQKGGALNKIVQRKMSEQQSKLDKVWDDARRKSARRGPVFSRQTPLQADPQMRHPLPPRPMTEKEYVEKQGDGLLDSLSKALDGQASGL